MTDGIRGAVADTAELQATGAIRPTTIPTIATTTTPVYLQYTNYTLDTLDTLEPYCWRGVNGGDHFNPFLCRCKGKYLVPRVKGW